MGRDVELYEGDGQYTSSENRNEKVFFFSYYGWIGFNLVLPLVDTITDLLFVLFLQANKSCVETVFERSQYDLNAIRFFALVSFVVGTVFYLLQIHSIRRYLKKPGKDFRGYIGAMERDWHSVSCTGIRIRKVMMTLGEDLIQVILTLIVNSVLGSVSIIVIISLIVSCISIARTLSLEATRLICCVMCPCCGGCRDRKDKGCFCNLTSNVMRAAIFLVFAIVPAVMVFLSTTDKASVSYAAVTVDGHFKCTHGANATLEAFTFRFTDDSDPYNTPYGTGTFLGNNVGKNDAKFHGPRIRWYDDVDRVQEEELVLRLGLRKAGMVARWRRGGGYKEGFGEVRYRFPSEANPKYRALTNSSDTLLIEDSGVSAPSDAFDVLATAYYVEGVIGRDVLIECPPGSGTYAAAKGVASPPNFAWTAFSLEISTLQAESCT